MKMLQILLFLVAVTSTPFMYGMDSIVLIMDDQEEEEKTFSGCSNHNIQTLLDAAKLACNDCVALFLEQAANKGSLDQTLLASAVTLLTALPHSRAKQVNPCLLTLNFYGADTSNDGRVLYSPPSSSSGNSSNSTRSTRQASTTNTLHLSLDLSSINGNSDGSSSTYRRQPSSTRPRTARERNPLLVRLFSKKDKQ